ncbi:MAG TPA: LysR substrate-binding domain-containing protein [Polyangiaceae bacterium]
MNDSARTASTQLSNLDLNLFLVLHTVLVEGSVTRAAERLSVTQSAVSNALGRLREVFRDPLFVRHGRGLVPTPRAHELAPLVQSALGELQAAVDGAAFVPEKSTRRFTLAWSDAQSIAHFPTLLPRFEQNLPNATLRIVTVDYVVATDGLSLGEVDVAVGPEQATFPPLLSESMYTERIVLAARRDHAKLVRCLLREQFDAIEFVDVQLALGKGGLGNMLMTELLARHGLSWRVGVVVPEFTAAAHAAAVSDYVVGLPVRAARAFCEFLPLELIELPRFLKQPTLNMALIWHPRTDQDAGARYFRNLVLEACRESAPAPRTTTRRGSTAPGARRRGRRPA